MKHLIISREYPPAPYPVGGIGTYVRNMAHLLAEAGEIVHVIAQRWTRAPHAREETIEGRLIVHRVPMEPGRARAADPEWRRLFASDFPPQAFAWKAGLLAEKLIGDEAIDVVEGQDWEAPLYFLQLRRAEGLGPKRQPPLLVHLHSPTEMIVSANRWDSTRPDRAIAAQLEEQSIQAADGWLSPSRFLADKASIRYGIPFADIQVTPYPLAPAPAPSRSFETWQTGPIVYLGRMEARKGVLDWVKAAIARARRDQTARFELAGPDSRSDNGFSLRRAAEQLVPAELANQFVFHGGIASAEVGALFRRARIAVVPSQWDNLPNSCLEAMQSGLPVLTTREGGMAEVVTDGETGWLAERADAAGLAAALDRALFCRPEKLAAIGLAASQEIRRICDPDRIVAAHLLYRWRLIERGSAMLASSIKPVIVPPNPGFVPTQHRASLRAVSSLPLRRKAAVAADTMNRMTRRAVHWERLAARRPKGLGLGPGVENLVSVVMPFLNAERFLPEAIESVLAQTYPTWELLLIDDGSETPATELARRFQSSYPDRIRYLEHEGHRNLGEGASRNLGIRSSRGQYIAFLDSDDFWLPHKLSRQVEIMTRHPQVGMVYGINKQWLSWSGKSEDADRDHVRPNRVPVDTVIRPGGLLIPFILEEEHPIPSDVMFRRGAIDRAGGHEENMPPGGVYEDTRVFAKLFLTEHVYKSSETWLWYRIRSDSVLGRAQRTGGNLRARLEFLLWFADYVRRANVSDLEFLRVLKETVQLSRRLIAEGPWWARTVSPNRAKLAVGRRHSRLSIQNAETGVPWDVQLNNRQPGVKAGEAYQLRFAARADQARQASVGVSRVDPPFDALGLYQEVELKTEWDTVKLAFVASGDTELSRIHFDLGLEPIGMEVKDVALTHLANWDPELAPAEEPEDLVEEEPPTWSIHLTEWNSSELKVRWRGKKARVEIEQAENGMAYDVQVNVRQGPVTAGRRYLVRFEARADRPRLAILGVARFGEPWDGLGCYQQIELSSKWAPIEVDFVAQDDADVARVHFDLGLESIPVEIRSVTLSESDESPS